MSFDDAPVMFTIDAEAFRSQQQMVVSTEAGLPPMPYEDSIKPLLWMLGYDCGANVYWRETVNGKEWREFLLADNPRYLMHEAFQDGNRNS